MIIRKRRRRWAGDYGDTHRGWVLYLFGCPIFRWRRRIKR